MLLTRQQTRKVRDACLCLLVSVIAFLAITWTLIAVIKADFKQLVVQESEVGLARFDRLAFDVENTLVQLNNLDVEQCDAEILLEMRKKQFLSPHVRDIGYLVDDKLVCSSGLGIVDNIAGNIIPDFFDIRGNSIWQNTELALFSGEYNGVLVRKNNFNVVVDRSQLDTLITRDLVWELVFDHRDQNIHIAGQVGVYQKAKLLADADHYRLCSDRTGYCLGFLLASDTFVDKYKVNLALATVLSILFATFIYFLCDYGLQRYRTVKSRVGRGFNTDKFYCLYQPIVELNTQKIIGVEVLARFRDIDGYIGPDQFLPVIKELNLSWAFTKQVIAHVQKDCESLIAGNPEFKLNINFFPRDFATGDVNDLVELKGTNPILNNIVIEVIEDEKLMVDSATEALCALRNAGFTIALDDFGSGYSNLQSLKQLQCDTLKIDRSFTNDIQQGAVRSSLIPHIVDMAKDIGANVVAEGVESESQIQPLIDIGVKYGQGWYFGKPMPMTTLIGRIK